jgi:hypothetical protein
LLLTLTLFVLCLEYSSCRKPPDPTPDTPLTEEDKLPPATQEGKGTFGCLVNGKVWKPKSGGLLQPGIQPSYNEVNGHFQLFLKNENSNIRLNVLDFFTIGKLNLTKEQSYFSDTASACVSLDGLKEFTDIEGGPIIFTTIDLIKGIISGTFDFTGKNIECQDSVIITSGRFDIKYK